MSTSQSSSATPPVTNRNLSEQILEIFGLLIEISIGLIKIVAAIILSVIELIIPKKLKSVKGEIVLITGGGHGMGKEMALLYASEGATVVIWDINKEMADNTVTEIVEKGYKANAFLCDVSNPEVVSKVAKEVQSKIGDVTILINNAGILPTRPLLEHTREEIKRIMNINVMAHFWTLEAFLPAMKKNNHGHIVAMSSVAGLSGFPLVVPYCCSKFAVRGIMEALREELRDDRYSNINLTTICPYMVDTGLCKKPYIRFKNCMPMLHPREVAAEIVNAQRRNLEEITVPKYLSYIFGLERWFPSKVRQYVVDFIASGLAPDNQ